MIARTLFTALVAVLLSTAASAPVLAQVVSSAALRVMSFNIRYGTANDGEDHWDKRKDFLVDVVRSEAPDVMGVQEAL